MIIVIVTVMVIVKTIINIIVMVILMDIPVKDNFLTLLLTHSSEPTLAAFSFEHVITLRTPEGTPAISPNLAKAKLESGVSSLGLSITVQPAARAGAIFRAPIANGKFHGVIAAHTPTGTYYDYGYILMVMVTITITVAVIANAHYFGYGYGL